MLSGLLAVRAGHTGGMSSDGGPVFAGAPSAAFFDLDNTLLHGASLFLIGRGMHARGVVSTGDVLRGAWQQLVFRLVGNL